MRKTNQHGEYLLDSNIFWVSPYNPRASLYNIIHQEISNTLRRAFTGQHDNFLRTLKGYATLENEGVFAHLVELGAQRIREVLLTQNLGNSEITTILDNLSQDYLLDYITTEDLVFVGVRTDLQTTSKGDWYPTELYTRSIPILHYLHSTGQLDQSSSSTLQRLQQRVPQDIQQGSIPLVRLDEHSYIGGITRYKAVIPNTSPIQQNKKEVTLIPLGVFGLFATLLKKEGKKYPLQFLERTETGTRKGTFTTKQKQATLLQRLKGQEQPFIGFDLATRKFYAFNPDQRSQDGQPKMVSFRLEMLTAIKPVKLHN